MAICHFYAGIISRGEGHSVVAAAAYRAGERIVEMRTGQIHDYRRRSGVDSTEILAPAGAQSWTRDRATLWNRVEQAERRRDAQLARAFDLALPRDLDAATNQALTREFLLRHLVSRGMVVDVAFHDLDGPNPHAHPLATMRELDGHGFAARKNREWNGRELVSECREGLTTLVNEYLARANVPREAWIDHRTLEAQRQEALLKGDYERALKLCRVPSKHLGKAATAILARGGISTRAQDLEQEKGARAAEMERMLWEVELHREQVAQLRGEEGVERRLEDGWWEEAEKIERERSTRIEAVETTSRGRRLYRRKLDELDPGWRDRGEPKVAAAETALTHAEEELARIEAERRAAEERRLAEAKRERAVRLAEIERRGGGDLYAGKLDELDPGWRAQGEPKVAAAETALTHAEEELARIEAERRAAEERRLAEAKRERAVRLAEIERRGGGDLYAGKLDELDPGWRAQGEPKVAAAETALTHAEEELARIEAERRAAEERRLAEAKRERAVRLAEIERRGGGDLYAGKLDELDPGWRAQGEPKVAAAETALTHAEEELARIEAERRAAEERRLAEAKRERAVRLAEIERRGGGDLYAGKLDELDPGWRARDEPKVAAAETALRHAEEELARIEAERRAAEERRLAEAKRERAVRLAEIERRGGGDLYAGKLDELDPGWRARDEPKVAAAETALTHAEEELARIEAERRAAEERRLAEAKRERAVRLAEIERRGGGDLYAGKLDELDPGWRAQGEPKVAAAETALTHAEEELARIEAERRAAEERRLAEAKRQRAVRLAEIERRGGGDLYAGKLDELDPGWRDRGEPKVAAAETALTHAEEELARIEAERRAAEERRLAEAKRERAVRLAEIERRGGGDLYVGKLDELDPGWRAQGESKVAAAETALTHAEEELARIEAERRAAEERRLAEAKRERAVRLAEIERRGGGDLYAGKLDELDPGWRAQGEPKVAAAETALTHAEEELARIEAERRAADVARRAGEIDALFEVPGGDAGFLLALDRQKPNWREAGTSSDVDSALDISEQSPDRGESATQHQLVLDAERTFHRASSIDWRKTSDAFRGGTGTDDRARAVSRRLSDRARAREIVAGGSDVASSPSVVGRLVEWLRRKVEKLLRGLYMVKKAAAAAMGDLPKTRPWPHSRPDHWVPNVSDKAEEPASDADPFVTDVHADVRDLLDRAAASDGGYSHEDREQAEKAYLKPLVDGTLRRQEASWSASSGAPRPTEESARAVVFERHRKMVEEVILVACYKETGRPASAEGLEQYRDDVRRGAAAAMGNLPKTRPWPHSRPDHWVFKVSDKAEEPASDADPFVTDVHADVRDLLDRAAASNGGYSHEDREQAEKAYLKPLVDGTLRRQEASWSASSGAPRPTEESARAVVFERHRKMVEEVILVACYKETGRPASAEGLEQYRDDVRRGAAAAMGNLPKTRPWPHSRPDHWVFKVSDKAEEPASDADPFVTDVYADVRDLLDRAAASNGGYSHEDREQAEKAYLKPLVDGTLRRQEASWSASSGAPRPTEESARAVVFERHRKMVEEVILVACYKETGRPANAEGLEQYRDDVRRVAAAAMGNLPKTRPWPHSRPDHWVFKVSDKAEEPASDADPFVTDVYADVRDLLDRAAASDGGYSHLDREQAEEAYLESLLKESLKQQERASASETESSQRREAIRKRLQREHRARLLNTVIAACLEPHCDGVLVDGRSGRISGPAQVAGAASPTELLGSTADDGSSLDAGSRLVADQSRTDPAEEAVEATQSHHASLLSLPAAKVTIVFERGKGTWRIKEETEHGPSRQLKDVQTIPEGLSWLARQGWIESERIPELERKLELDLRHQRSR